MKDNYKILDGIRMIQKDNEIFGELCDLHAFIIRILIVILCLVIGGLHSIKYNWNLKGWISNMTIEIIWTIIPGILLIMIGYPSFRLLYSSENIKEFILTWKIIGKQWYWTYETIFENEIISIDSYIKENINMGELRLLEVDNTLKLPVETPIRLIITGGDVIHSFAVPNWGIKMDAIPGRLNSIGIMILKIGTYYGQCSELCGSLHYSMPIKIEIVDFFEYLIWLTSL